MKKTLIFAAIVLGALSCSKEDVTPVVEQQQQPLVFTAVIDNPVDTKTSIDAASGKVSWVMNDEITITDASSNKAIYSVTAIDGDGKATFTYKTGSTSLSGSYSAKYGNVNDQWYNGNNGANCPMTSYEISAPSTEFHFTNDCGVFNISATASNIAKIIVSNGTDSYALNFTTAVSGMTAGTDYYMIAVPGGFNCNKISFVKADGSKYTKDLSEAKTVGKGHLKKLKFTGTDFGNNTNYTGSEPLALPGVFSVSATKKVRFSKGLVCTDGASPATITYSACQYEDKKHNSAFNTSGMQSLNIPTGWAMLTKTEWDYLFYKRNVDSEIKGIDISKSGYPETTYTNLRLTSAVIQDESSNSIYGVFIYPDYFRFPQDIADRISQWEKDNKSTSSTKKFYTYINYSVAGNLWQDKFVFTNEEFLRLQNLGVVFLGAFARYSGNTIVSGNENTVFMMYPNTGAGDNNALSITYAFVNEGNWHGTTYKGNVRLATTVPAE